MDETNVKMGVAKKKGGAKLVGAKGGDAPRHVTFTGSHHITAVSTNNAAGENLRPMFIGSKMSAAGKLTWTTGGDKKTKGPCGTAKYARGDKAGTF
jgi:hypothetical protein